MLAQLEIAKQRFAKDEFAKLLGIVLDDLSESTVQMHMHVRQEMNNWFGLLHGGAIYSLADAAFSVLANNSVNIAVALDCSMTYHVSPEHGTKLIVQGETLSASRRTAAYIFKVYMQKEETLTLVATMKSVSYKTNKAIDSVSNQ